MLAAQQWRMLAMTMGSPGWLLMLAQLWITDRAEEELSRRELHSSAHDLSTRTRILVGDHEFGRSPKEMSAMAWATGGQGVRHENETGMMFMLPPGSSLLTRNDHGRPHQDFLPFMDQDPDRSSLPITMAHAHREVMPVTSTKLMLLTLNFLLTAKSPRAMKTTLRELTKEVNPGARIVRSHYETVADALQTLDGLSVVLPNHNWVSYRIFDLPTPVRTPKPEDYDSDLLMGISSAFLEAVRSSHAGSSYSGYFLYSLTGAMGLPANRPALMRHYLRASSWWNAERVKGGSPSVNIETERWAIITNTMTLSAVEGRRDQKSRSITNTIKDLQELADRKLVVAKRIDKKRIILEIPENLEAAYKQIYEGKRNVRNPSR
jgi:hypothetical protein